MSETVSLLAVLDEGEVRSAHAAGAQFLFADGSIRLLAHGTPPATVRTLLTPQGGELEN